MQPGHGLRIQDFQKMPKIFTVYHIDAQNASAIMLPRWWLLGWFSPPKTGLFYIFTRQYYIYLRAAHFIKNVVWLNWNIWATRAKDTDWISVPRHAACSLAASYSAYRHFVIRSYRPRYQEALPEHWVIYIRADDWASPSAAVVSLRRYFRIRYFIEDILFSFHIVSHRHWIDRSL